MSCPSSLSVVLAFWRPRLPCVSLLFFYAVPAFPCLLCPPSSPCLVLSRLLTGAGDGCLHLVRWLLASDHAHLRSRSDRDFPVGPCPVWVFLRLGVSYRHVAAQAPRRVRPAEVDSSRHLVRDSRAPETRVKKKRSGENGNMEMTNLSAVEVFSQFSPWRHTLG